MFTHALNEFYYMIVKDRVFESTLFLITLQKPGLALISPVWPCCHERPSSHFLTHRQPHLTEP